MLAGLAPSSQKVGSNKMTEANSTLTLAAKLGLVAPDRLGQLQVRGLLVSLILSMS